MFKPIQSVKIAWIACCLLLLLKIAAQAQQVRVRGTIKDKVDQQPLAGATVLLINPEDTTQVQGTAADDLGIFELFHGPGKVLLRVEYAAYTTYNKEISLSDSSFDAGTILMEASTLVLHTAVIKGKLNLAQQKGDTTEYNAGAFKTNRDANAQDLIGKMPGVVNDNGTIKAQGEAVTKVLVDGKEFFGDDATIALRNLPAEIIDKVQVFDKLSDQSQFTGFDDGNTQKTINIVTKAGRNNGVFGRVYAGYGTNQRYSAGGSMNSFHGNRRITVLGLANNINQQNFSSQDLTGVTSSQGGRGGGGGGAPNRGGGGGGANNFNVSQAGGISTTQSVGLNYTDNWGTKLKVTASYFLNKSKNYNLNVKKRNYLLTNEEQVYNETNNTTADNLNHRFSGRFEYNIDSSNSLLLTPRLTYQNASSGSMLSGLNTFSDSIPVSRTDISNSTTNQAYNFANDLLYRHKFQKKGRTISVNVNTNLSNRNGSTGLQSTNSYFQPRDSTAIVNQITNLKVTGNTLGTSFNYTEPISKSSILQFNYNPSYTWNISDKETNAYDENVKAYVNRVPRLSSKFNNQVTTERGGLGYRLRKEKMNLMLNVNYQYLTLTGKQNYPTEYSIEKNFNSVLPGAMLNYKFTKTKSLRVNYRTNTNVPSVSQLQTVIDNSNPLQLSTGNPQLNQEYAQNLNVRYSSTRSSAASAFLLYLNGNITSHYITNEVIIARENTVLADSVVLNKGSQLSRPVNLNGYMNINAFTSYGIPVDKLKTNVNLNAGLGLVKTPGLMNGSLNNGSTYTFSSGVVLSSNVSEKLDFTLSYTGNYNIVRYSIQEQLNNNYFYHTGSFKFTWMPWKGLVLFSDLSNTLYSGLGPGFDRNFFLWNPAIGYKFLKNQAGDLRLSSFDLLNQNNSISRTTTANYIEDNRTKVLNRYFILTFTYTFRNFKGADKTSN